MSVITSMTSLEAARSAAVAALEPAFPEQETALGHVTEIARRLFSAPIALVSLVGADRQTFRAKSGLDICETSREVSFCSHAVADRSLVVVEDALEDPRFAQNPLVTGEPFIRFYAGAPLVTRGGHAVGALCVLDHHPRPPLTAEQARMLTGLAELAATHLERRRLSAAHEAAVQLAAATPDAMITADGWGAITSWNAAAETIFGYSQEEAIGAPLELIIPEEARQAHRRGVQRLGADRRRRVPGVVTLQAQRRDGMRFPVEMSLAHWADDAGVQFAAVVRDVSERRREQDALHQLTHFDGLTGLPNRVAFLRVVDELIREQVPYSFLKVGLDGFKAVNESLGLPGGDEVLKAAAHRVALAAGDGALTARLGGDELGVLLKGGDDPLHASVVAERVLAALSEPFPLPKGDLRLTASIGLVLSPGLARPASATEALTQGLLALQDAKRAGGGRRQLFSLRMSQQAEERQRLNEALQRAVERREFELHYQPQVRLSDGALVGAEALLRWRRPDRGLVGPGAFLMQLEATELSLPVGRWILQEACRVAAGLSAAGAPVRMGVNLFSGQLRSAGFEAEVEEALRGAGLAPELLELEITETTVLGAEGAVVDALRSLRRRGVGVAFDDYGTGYASLSLLKRYPISRLKIDREFVTHLRTDGADASIVRAVLALGRSMGLEVIAEGVETPEQAALLTEMGCREAQGFLFGAAVTRGAFERMAASSALGGLAPGAPVRCGA